MANGGSYMSMPISNSLGVQMCMSSDYHSGANTYYGAAAAPAYTGPQQSHYPSQSYGGSLVRSRPRSGLCKNTELSFITTAIAE